MIGHITFSLIGSSWLLFMKIKREGNNPKNEGK
jgi:hypothetical protein